MFSERSSLLNFMYSKISEWMLKRVLYITKFWSLCFIPQILLSCSFPICLGKAFTESRKSGQLQKIREFKTWSAENKENGGKSKELRENKRQLFYWSIGHSFIGGSDIIIMWLRKRKRLSHHQFLVLVLFLYCFSHFEDIHTIKKCSFLKTVINKYKHNTGRFWDR